MWQCDAGEAYTLYTEDDACHLRPIANLVKESGGEVPEWMLNLKKEKWSSKVCVLSCFAWCSSLLPMCE